MRVHGCEALADEVLKAFAETAIAPSRLGDLRVRELIDRYLSWIDDDVTPEERARLRHLADDAVDPAVGNHFAALLNAADIVGLLERRRGGGATSGELRELHRFLAGVYRWTRDNRWASLDPTDGAALGDILR